MTKAQELIEQLAEGPGSNRHWKALERMAEKFSGFTGIDGDPAGGRMYGGVAGYFLFDDRRDAKRFHDLAAQYLQRNVRRGSGPDSIGWATSDADDEVFDVWIAVWGS